MLFGNSPRFAVSSKRPSPGPGHYKDLISDDRPHLVEKPVVYPLCLKRDSYLKGILQGEIFVFRPREISFRPQAYTGQSDLLNKPSFNVLAISETRKRMLKLKTVDAFY